MYPFTDLKLTGYHKSLPWSEGSFETPLSDSFSKTVVIELGMHNLKHNELIQETSSVRSLTGTRAYDHFCDIPPKHFVVTMEGLVNKLAKMFEGSLQHVWLVVSNKSMVSPNLIFFLPSRLSQKRTQRI